MLKHIAMVAVAVVMVLSAVSVVSTADPHLAPNAIKIGNYTMVENSTMNAVYNVSFVNDNYEATIVSSLNASGSPLLSGVMKLYNSDNAQQVGNLSVFNSGSENTVLFAIGSGTASASSMMLNLTSSASAISLTSAQQSYLQKHSGSVASTFLSNPIYKVEANGSAYIVFSNAAGSMSNGNLTLSYSGSSTLSGNLVLGISSISALKNTIENEVQHHEGSPFSYNNTTGVVSGRFVSLDFNSTTGVVSNYASPMLNSTIFTSIEASGNGTIGVNSPSPVYPTSQPIVVGGVMFYGNNTVVYQFHNNPSMVSNMFLSNGTMNLTVAGGLNVTTFRPQVDAVQHERLNSTTLNYTGVDLGDQFDVSASSTILFIHNSTIRASLFVHGASVNVTNGTISILTNGTAKISFVAPTGLQDMKKEVQQSIQYAIDHGKLAALVTLGSAGNYSTNLSVSYNSSMQISVQNVSSGSVTVKVDSAHHEGTNFAIYVPNGVISNNSRITLAFDGQTISLSSSVNSVVNATSTVNASFYYVSVSGGTLVVIHVPHFSTHTIQISTASASPGGNLPGIGGINVIYIAAGIVGAIVVIAAVGLVRRRK